MIFRIHTVLVISFFRHPQTKTSVEFCSPVFDLLWSRPHYLIFAQASPAKLNVKIFHHMHLTIHTILVLSIQVFTQTISISSYRRRGRKLLVCRLNFLQMKESV